MKHEDVKNLSVSDQSTQSTNQSSLVQSINKDSGRLILFSILKSYLDLKIVSQF